MGTIFVCAFLLSVCASLSMAQSSVDSSARLERDRMDRIMDAGANIEEFRQEYLNYLGELQDDMRLFSSVPVVQRKFSAVGLKPIAMLEKAKAAITSMTAEELVRMRAAYSKVPGWRQMPDALIRPDLRKQLQANLEDQRSGQASIVKVTPDNCSDPANATVTNTDISVSTAFVIAGEIVMESLPTDALTFEGHAAASVLLGALKGATLALQTLKDIREDCKTDDFQADITTKLTAVPGLITASTTTTATNIGTSTSTTATNISTSTSTTATNITTAKTAIINNDNTNTTTILTAIDTARNLIVADAHANKDEMKNLLLRTQIEADLASTDGSTFVALYETPATICRVSLNDRGLPQFATLPPAGPIAIPQCGLLDLVRSIVRDTITNVGAGTNAQSFYVTAEAQRADGKYKAAYTSYRQAYKAASK